MHSFYLDLLHDNAFSKEAGNDVSSWRINLYKEGVCVVAALREGWKVHFGDNQEMQ